MEVTTWCNGSQDLINGAGFGIRIAVTDFELIQNWVQINVGDKEISRENIPFTKKCPEIRSAIIGLFLIENNLHKWPYGSPHRLQLVHLGNNIYRLTR
jgi:hypothetical protein